MLFWVAPVLPKSAFAVPQQSLGASQAKADSIVIHKKDHVMELMAHGKVIRTYKVALGSRRVVAEGA
jgi:hypothetical protein